MQSTCGALGRRVLQQLASEVLAVSACSSTGGSSGAVTVAASGLRAAAAGPSSTAGGAGWRGALITAARSLSTSASVSADQGSKKQPSGAVRGDAKQALNDPMSQLLASRGMPLGMSLNKPDSAPEDLAAPAKPEPAYDLEALNEVIDAARSRGASSATAASSSGSGSAEAAAAASADAFGMQVDSWATTRRSTADIAKKIAEANDAERAVDEADSSSDEDADSPMQLSASEAKYGALEDISRDIKKLDEVWEVLASVPWLDEGVLEEKELKGVAQYGLLGTLEEVGFDVQYQVQRVWAGERNQDIVLEGVQYRDQAALLAIMYHTKQLEDKYGPPPNGFLPAPPPPPPSSADAATGIAGSAERVQEAMFSSLAGLPSQRGEKQ